MNEFLPMPVVPTNSASACDEKGEYNRAIAYFDEAIRLKPSDAVAYYMRGLAYGRQGDYDRAIADMTESIRLVPKYANAYQVRGIVYSLKNKDKRAIADYTEVIRLAPKRVDAYEMRALAYRAIGKQRKADCDDRKAEALKPPKDPKTSKTTLTIWMTAGGAFAHTYDKEIIVLIDDKEKAGQVGEPIEVEPGKRTVAIKSLGGCSNGVTVAVQNHDKIDLVCGVSRESILILGILSAVTILLIHATNRVWFGLGLFVVLSLSWAGIVMLLKPIWAIDTLTLRLATSDKNIPRTKHNYSWLAAIFISYGLFIWCRAVLLP